MLNGVENALNRISNFMLFGFKTKMSSKEFLEREIMRWKGSPERVMQIKGQLYYQNEHDILTRKRTMIGEDGKLQVIENLPNNRLIDNQYAKMVNQKANYLLGQPFAIDGKNERYIALLKQIFHKKFMKTLKNSGKAALNQGIAWLYPYYTKDGGFSFRLFPGYEILPIWEDSEHTRLSGAVRLYEVSGYDGIKPTIIEKVEVFDRQGIHCYILDGNVLIPDLTLKEQDCAYVMAGNKPLNWTKIPLIPLKCNEQEIPLIKRVKSLQDGINVMLSDFENHMQEDARNTILVLKNYDGTNLGEFRKNLAAFGAVKVRYDGETKGGVETLEIKVNADNYKSILEIFKKALIENAMGYDAKDDRLSGNPNQMNIQSMYSDIDLDANEMETEFQAAFEEILWFVNAHLANTGQGSFENEEVTIIFNRDMLMDEGQVIENIKNSVGILSKATLVAQHPWVDDVDAELTKIKEEELAEAGRQQGYNPFEQPPQGKGGDVNEG